MLESQQVLRFARSLRSLATRKTRRLQAFFVSNNENYPSR